MTAKKQAKPKLADLTSYIVFTPTTVTVVPALDVVQAREVALDNAGLAHKPYLARDWVVRKATKDEVEQYAAAADANGKSRPTARVAKNPPKSVRAKLPLFD